MNPGASSGPFPTLLPAASPSKYVQGSLYWARKQGLIGRLIFLTSSSCARIAASPAASPSFVCSVRKSESATRTPTRAISDGINCDTSQNRSSLRLLCHAVAHEIVGRVKRVAVENEKALFLSISPSRSLSAPSERRLAFRRSRLLTSLKQYPPREFVSRLRAKGLPGVAANRPANSRFYAGS